MKQKNINKYYKLPILDGLELLNAQRHTLDFPFHTHDSYNISLISQNTFNLKLTDKLLKAPKGSIVITNPSELHATPCDSIHGVSFFTFYIPAGIFQHLNNNCSVFFKDKIIEDTILFSQFFYLSLKHQSNEINFENKLICALKILIDKYHSTKGFNTETVRLFKDYINEIDLFDNFSLDRAAFKFGLDKYKFLRLFKQETGLTPTNFILLKRVNKSKVLLSEQRNITDVAISSGFYDASHFYRNFIKYTGISPSEYQKAIL